MIPLRRLLALTAAITTAATGSLMAGPAAAREIGGTAPCLTRAEYRAIDKGMRLRRVVRIVDTSGQRVSSEGKRTTRRHTWCGSGATVDIVYRKNRVVRKLSTPGTQSTTSWTGDIDGDGTVDQVAFIDLDGNTTTDARIDLRRDGRDDVIALDANGDGAFDSIAFDTGTARIAMSDRNYDGYFETVMLDAEVNGRFERAFLDDNADGYFEWTVVDAVGNDGVFDTYQQTRGTQTHSTATTLNTQNFVTLNQLGRLYSASNPWVGSYYTRPNYWAQPPSRLLTP